MFITRVNGWDIHVFEVAAHVYSYTMFNPDAAQSEEGWIRTGHGHTFDDTDTKARGRASAE